ncbi:MAG TPA: YihY/virulence factor BrkB family protein [Puia sp.]|uniref:YihY/virulence factor BrkB family protein n=1 Tax=Puia sp. TaxID=2045100 RepID=UPI002CB809A0|nr:YihY/virulence factor BrkB family protein [Puia sp.]HVU95314.1 YihY/virulence factor BrkB family protein [Puia sp.]
MDTTKDTRHTITAAGQVLRTAYRLFRQNDPLRMAAATSFFVSFALPPIFYVLIIVLGLFGNRKIVGHDLFQQLSVGLDSSIAAQVREVVRNIRRLPLSLGMQIGGFVFMLFVATTLFEIVKNSINQLWKIRGKAQQGVGFVLLNRIRAVVVILLAGILFSVVLLGDAGGWLLPLQVNAMYYRVIMFVAVTIWFFVILKYLSYGRPQAKIAWSGAVFTTLLFALGQQLLQRLLNYDSMKIIYGTSTALALLLLFVFYCSFIFYFGACFTWALGQRVGLPIQPSRHGEVVEAGPIQR